MKPLPIVISFLTLSAYGQKIPKVHFNHAFLVIDSVDLSAIKNSDFIKDQFAAFSTQTANADNGSTWTGSYIYGTDNYFEIFEPSGVDDSIGTSGIGLSVDSTGEIFEIDSILKKDYKTEMQTRERKMDDKMLPWFTSLEISDSIFFSRSHIDLWLMEYKRDYFDYNHWTYHDNLLTRANYLKHYDEERKNKILKRFTGITLKVTEQEREFFTNFLAKCGYTKTSANTFVSPDNFLFQFTHRDKNDRYSIASLDFEANNSGNKTIVISKHAEIVLDFDKGKIVFR